ncbi:MAG: N4-gp56 family major capsid protein [Clostridiales bacterium]|nr:N4-gp56 family major capsid protein [Clostridiales bacterium]
MKDYITLQLFAEAGTVVNATNGYVNAYTGARDAFTTTQTLAPELKEFYDTELLENARIEMYYAQFGKKQPLPRNHGGKVEWRKWKTFAKAGKLEEGVIPQGQKFGVTNIYGNIDQYGTYTAITDKLELRAYDDVILGATEEMGASAAETGETLIRDALLTGTNVLYCENIAPTTGAFVSAPDEQYEMRNDASAVCRLTPDMVNRARTKLVKDRAPTINGKYYAVIHPSVAYDLRSNEEWIEAHKYAAPEQLFNGEIGELHGVRFIENTFAPVLVYNGALDTSTGRFLTIATAPATNSSGVGTKLTDAGDAGIVDAVVAVTTETPNADLVGHYLCALDETGATAAATLDFHGRALVTGVDASTKKIYFHTNPFTDAAKDDYFVSGDGGAEVKGGDQNAAYATYFFGKDAFGIIDPEGGGLEMILHDKDEIGGPLNQFSTIGYKFETNGATILYPERILRVMSCSHYSDTDDAN